MLAFHDTIIADATELEAAFAEAARLHAAGQAATILPADGELAMPAAADFLNVPNAYLAKLLDEGVLPSRGTHAPARFVQVRALAAYRVRRDAEREEALAAMAAQAQELGIYDM